MINKILKIMTTILLLNVFLVLLMPRVKANTDVSKPLICVVGYDYSDLLEYSGYKVINGFVDFNHVGTFYLTYEEINTKKTFTKRIDVIKETDIQDVYYQYETRELILKSSEIIDTCALSNFGYILSKDNHNIYLSKYANNKVLETVLVSNMKDVTLRKILVDDNNIYIVGTIYIDNHGIDLYILSYDHNLNKINENTIGGLGTDNAYDATILGDYIYISGSTTSSGGFFEGTRKQEDAFLLKVSKEFLYPEIIKISTLDYINEIKMVCAYLDNIYIVEQYSDGTNIKYNISIYNTNLEVHSKSFIENSYGLTPEKLISCEEGVYLISYQYNYPIDKYSSKVFKVKDKANLNIEYEYVNYDNSNVRIVDYITCNNITYILMYDFNEEQTLIYLQNENVTICLNNAKKPVEFFNNPFTFIDSSKLMTSYYYIYKQDQILINGDLCELSDKSNINQNHSYFGDYIDLCVYESDQLTLAFTKTTSVDLDVSVLDHEIFDLNLILKFNGKGRLNNKEIESGYIVKEEGEYILEITGNNNEKRIFSFTVKDISNKNYKETDDKLLLSSNVYCADLQMKEIINFKETVKNQIANKYYYGILLIPLLLIIIPLILLFGGRKKNEK